MDEDFGVDLDRVRAFLAEKERRRRLAVDERYARATRDARAIVSEIAAQVNPRRIYQWGSLLNRDRFSEISDLDIAVEGLNGRILQNPRYRDERDDLAGRHRRVGKSPGGRRRTYPQAGCAGS